MSSANRERRARNREARAAAEVDARRRIVRQRITFASVGLVLAAGLGIALVARAHNNGNGAAATTTSSTASTTTTTLASVKGKPCLAEQKPFPAKTPHIPIVVGPPPTKLLIRDLKTGTGPEVKPGASVTVDYVLAACSTGKVIESSFAQGTPATLSLSQVVQGWSEGIPGMKVGGVRLLGVPSALGYKETGGPGIAPDESLWFVVKLLKIG